MPETDMPDGLVFKTSSYSGGGDCVEVGLAPDGDGVVAVRHSQQPDGPALTFTSAEWHAFVRGVKKGEFDFPVSQQGN